MLKITNFLVKPMLCNGQITAVSYMSRFKSVVNLVHTHTAISMHAIYPASILSRHIHNVSNLLPVMQSIIASCNAVLFSAILSFSISDSVQVLGLLY